MKVTSYFLNFDFTGRARRSHYWANLGCWLGFFVLLGILAMAAGAGGSQSPLMVVVGLGVLVGLIAGTIDGMAVVFRRAHDTGRSGWIWLLLLIPFVNFLALYWLLIQDSDQGPNKYGPPVKQFYQPAATVA